MGVYPRNHIVEVSKRASTFLEEIRSLLPEKFSTRYKNLCWSAEQPKDYPGWQDMVLSYFHYGVRQLRPGRAWRFSHFLSKPINDYSNSSITLISSWQVFQRVVHNALAPDCNAYREGAILVDKNCQIQDLQF